LELCELSIAQAESLLEKGEVSSVELTQAVLERIEAVESRVRAYVTMAPQQALEQARAADKRRAQGQGGALLGIPLAIKDIICTKDMPTTCASKILENFISPYEATVIERLRREGVVILGKTNLDEFAMGSSTENSAFFPTCNPWDLERVPGGSSGGSAAAVAAGEALGALGTDTGGSVRQPASFCGIVGLKPTYGRVSRYGLVAFASSLDQIGPLTKDVADCALLMNAIAHYDSRDSTCANAPTPDYASSLVADVRGMRVGIPREYFVEGMEPQVEEAVRRAVEHLEGLGAEVDEVSLAHTEYALPTYYLIAPAEASANLARYDGIKYGLSYRESVDMWDTYRRTRQFGFGAEVKRRIMLGTYALSAGYYDAYYLKAQKVRTLIRQDFDRAFARFDVLVAPVAPTPAFKIGEKVEDPLQMYLSDIFTLSLNLAGLCGVSIPCGFAVEPERGKRLPIGMQILGPAFGEEAILRVAYAYEQTTNWHRERPKLDGGCQGRGPQPLMEGRR